jgi:polygalacturonase
MKQRTRVQGIKARTYPGHIRRDQIQKAWSTAKLRETVSVMDFGADPTGVADSYQAFVDALAASNSVFVPEGTFRVDQRKPANVEVTCPPRAGHRSNDE